MRNTQNAICDPQSTRDNREAIRDNRNAKRNNRCAHARGDTIDPPLHRRDALGEVGEHLRQHAGRRRFELVEVQQQHGVEGALSGAPVFDW